MPKYASTSENQWLLERKSGFCFFALREAAKPSADPHSDRGFLSSLIGVLIFLYRLSIRVGFRNILTMLDHGPNLVRIFLTWPQPGPNLFGSFP